MKPKKVSGGLVAMSSAAIVAIYSAGFIKTRAAADRQEQSQRPRPLAVSPVAAPALAPSPAPTPLPPPLAPPSPESSAHVTEPAPSKHPLPTRHATHAGTSPEKSNTATPPIVVPQAASEQPAVAALPDAPPAKANPLVLLNDGTYLGWGTSRHGDIQASVTLEGGKITAVSIAQCRTQYSCDVVDPLLKQILKRQSPEVDNVTGATQSVNALYWAVIDALNKAK